MRPLLFRLPLETGESWLSLLSRVESANFYTEDILPALVCEGERAPGRARRQLRPSIELPVSAATYRRLFCLTGIDPRTQYAATAHRFAGALMPPGKDVYSVPVPDVGGEAVEAVEADVMMAGLTQPIMRTHLCSKSTAQFCPLCLHEGAYHRLAWLPWAIAACIKHGCLLHDCCPSCRRSVSVDSVTEGTCPACNASLVDAEPISLVGDDFGLYAQESVLAWLLDASSAKEHAQEGESLASTVPILPAVLPEVSPPITSPVVYYSQTSAELATLPDTLPDAATNALYRLLYGLGSTVMSVKPYWDRWEYLHQLSVPGLEPYMAASSAKGNADGNGEERRATNVLASSRPRFKRMDSLSTYERYVLYATAFKALTNWPNGFYDFLSAVRDVARIRQTDRTQTTQLSQLSNSHSPHIPHAQSSTTVANELRGLYQFWLEQKWQHSSFRFVQDAFDRYLVQNDTAANRPSRTERYSKGVELIKKSGYMTLTEAARALGTRLNTIRRLVGAQRLDIERIPPNMNSQELDSYEKPQLGRTNRDRVLLCVERSKVEELQRRWSQPLTLNDAAQMLGIPPSDVLELVQARLLQAERGPTIDRSLNWTFSKQGINECLERLYKQTDELPIDAWLVPSSSNAGEIGVCVSAVENLESSTGSADLVGTGNIEPLRLMTLTAAVDALSAIRLTHAGVLKLLCKGKVRAFRLLPYAYPASPNQPYSLPQVKAGPKVRDGCETKSECIEGESNEEKVRRAPGASELVGDEEQGKRGEQPKQPEPYGLQGLLFSTVSVNRYIEEYTPARVGCIEVALRMGKYHHDLAKDWVSFGLLAVAEERNNEYWFDEPEVERFVREYMLNAAAAKLLRVSITKLHTYVRKGQLTPAASSRADGIQSRCRWRLFRRADVEHLASQLREEHQQGEEAAQERL